MTRRIPCLLLALSIPALFAGALPEPTPVRAFRHLDKQQTPSLPQSTVMALHQDELGLLWIATLDGLASFDGRELRPVSGPGAPAFGALRTISTRPAGGFYVGATTGLFVSDGSWRRLDTEEAVGSLVGDGGGAVWMVGRSGKLWRLDDDSGAGAWRPVDLPDGVERADHLQVQGGDVWMAHRGGVHRRSGGGWSPAVVGEPLPSSPSAFLLTANGDSWIAVGSGGLLHGEVGAETWTPVELEGWSGGRIRALAQDRRGRIWAGGNDGAAAFGRPGEPFTVWSGDNGLRREGVLSILPDREGTLWLSANGYGLQQLVSEEWSHRNRWEEEDAPPETRVQVFGIAGTQDGEGFLAAVFDRGVWHWDGRRMHQYGAAEGLRENVRSAVEAEPGRFWVGARRGIFEGPAGGPFKKTFDLPSGFVYGFSRGPDGAWWAFTSTAGVLKREAGRWRTADEINRQIPDLNVRDVLRRGDELWLGTMRGLALVKGGRVETLGDGDPAFAIHALLEVGDEVWAGGFGGIEVWRGGAVERRLTLEDGLPGQTTYSLAMAADGAVWAGGSAGVGRFADGGWRVWGVGSGLLESECNHQGLWTAPDGSVYVGTMGSLAKFDSGVDPLVRPELELQWNPRPPDSLPADQRSIRLAWSSPWLAPTSIEYRTRIPRLGDAWSSPKADDSLALENLGPGLWRVEVAARFVGEADWTEPLVAEWHVAPRFWETGGFYGLCGILLALVTGCTVRWRTRRLARRAKELELAVEEQLARLKILGGLLPICTHCKKVRDDAGYWQQIEAYIQERSQAEFSHSLCPSCLRDHYPDFEEAVVGAIDGRDDPPIEKAPGPL